MIQYGCVEVSRMVVTDASAMVTKSRRVVRYLCKGCFRNTMSLIHAQTLDCRAERSVTTPYQRSNSGQRCSLVDVQRLSDRGRPGGKAFERPVIHQGKAAWTRHGCGNRYSVDEEVELRWRHNENNCAYESTIPLSQCLKEKVRSHLMGRANADPQMATTTRR